MRNNGWAKRIAVGAGAAMVATLAFTAPALASSQPGQCNSGANCAVSGAVQVQATLTLSLGTSFTLTGQPGSTQTDDHGNAILGTIMSNDSGGYFVTETGPSAFIGSGTNSYTIPTADMLAEATKVQATDGTFTALSTSPLTVASSTTVSGASGDKWYFGWQMTIPANAPSDTYSGAISTALWGN